MNDTNIPFRLKRFRPVALVAGYAATLVYPVAMGASPSDCTHLAKHHLPAAQVLDAELIPAGRCLLRDRRRQAWAVLRGRRP